MTKLRRDASELEAEEAMAVLRQAANNLEFITGKMYEKIDEMNHLVDKTRGET